MQTTRNNKGSAITETGPALLILLVFILFPVLDLLYMGAGYVMAYTLHREEIRQVAVHNPNDWQTAINTADDQYLHTGAGNFLKLTRGAPLRPTWTPSDADPQEVTLDSQYQIRPFLVVPVPGLGEVPGLNGPLTVNFKTTRPQEEKGRD